MTRFRDCILFFFTDKDFDGDDMLGVNDLKQVIERLIGSQNRLPENDIKFLIQVKMVSLRFEFQLIL